MVLQRFLWRSLHQQRSRLDFSRYLLNRTAIYLEITEIFEILWSRAFYQSVTAGNGSEMNARDLVAKFRLQYRNILSIY